MRKSFGSVLLVSAMFVCIFTGGCSSAESVQYRDGVYEGEHSFVKVRVTVAQGKVSDIDILRHGGGGKKYADMIQPLCDEMVLKETLDVDAVTGATVSSKNLKEAVQNALQKAGKN